MNLINPLKEIICPGMMQRYKNENKQFPILVACGYDKNYGVAMRV